MITKTLVAINSLENKGIALPKWESQFLNDPQHLMDYLFVQFGICWVGDILLLNRSIYKGNIVMLVIIFFVINTNAFLKDEFYPLFANTIAKVYPF